MTASEGSSKLPPEVHNDLASWLDAIDQDEQGEQAPVTSIADGPAAEVHGRSGTSRPNNEAPQTIGEQSASEAFTLVRQLKEKPGEITDLVQDGAGTSFIRKRWSGRNPKLTDTYRVLMYLQSPALPHIRSIRETPSGTEVVRAYVPGPTLRAWVGARGPIPEAEARTLLAQVARGVHALHTCKPPIIHRDINPNNVIIGPNGPCLIDFGIARAFDPAADRDTHTWGTHGYAAPEQYGFGQSDARTDVFALGMLYWFLLTGTDPNANLSAQLTQATAEQAHRLGISAFSRDIIQECVTMAPERRFSNVDALINALATADAEAPDMTSGAGPAETPTADTSHLEADVTDIPAADSRTDARAEDSHANHVASPEVEPASPKNRKQRMNRPGETGRPRKGSRRAQPARRPHRSLLSWLWLIASSGFMAFIVIGAISYTIDPWRLDYPEALVRGGIAAFGIILMVAPTWLVTANPFGFRDRLPYLQHNRVRRCILLAAAGVIVGTVLIVAVSANLSPEYVRIMHQNGSASV